MLLSVYAICNDIGNAEGVAFHYSSVCIFWERRTGSVQTPANFTVADTGSSSKVPVKYTGTDSLE